MRHVCTVLAVAIGAVIAANVLPHDANAGFSPALSAPAVATALIEPTGYWKRRWRRDYDPDVVIPDAPVDLDVDGDIEQQITVPGETPPLVVIVPVRPASCGQYRYWDGARCVDARYHDPYIGPR
jgi:hypothetical protein